MYLKVKLLFFALVTIATFANSSASEALRKHFKSGKPSQEEKIAEREEKKQAVKDDKLIRALATKGHRLLDPMVSKFAAFSTKLTRASGSLELDTLSAFETSKTLLTEWHGQSQATLGKIAGGKTCALSDLGFDEKTLTDQVKSMKEVQKALNFQIAQAKAAAKAKK